MNTEELKTWLAEQLKAASEVYDQKGLERVRLEGEYAAFNAVLTKLSSQEEANVESKKPRRKAKTTKANG